MNSTVQEWKRTPIEGHDGKNFVRGLLSESDTMKVLNSSDYNYIFDKVSGHFLRWGRTQQDDPDFSPFGPELADVEIVSACRGVRDCFGNRVPCAFCYKSNGPTGGTNMSLETFKDILQKLGPQLTQVAFGVDAECTMNPDTFRIMEHCRSVGVVPNVTVADITPETADRLAALCGAVAVSYYPERSKDRCYDTVKMLTDRGMNQINIHCMVASERYNEVLELISDRNKDKRLARMYAIVFLSLKKKGRGAGFTQLGPEKFKNIVTRCLSEGISFGADSCSSHLFEQSIRDRDDYKSLMQMVEPCESFGIFSSYINSEGRYFPCSFCEGEGEWKSGIDVTKCESFLWDVWNDSLVNKYRERMLHNGRNCPMFKID